MQVQWNACYATGSLLRNDATAALAAKLNRLQPLLSALLALVRESPNYKVHSALPCDAQVCLVSSVQRSQFTVRLCPCIWPAIDLARHRQHAICMVGCMHGVLPSTAVQSCALHQQAFFTSFSVSQHVQCHADTQSCCCCAGEPRAERPVRRAVPRSLESLL